MKTYGYVRVSTQDQNDARQKMAMMALWIPPERIYTDKLSGKNFDRPAYQELVEKLQSGDLLYVQSIDRLGRNYEEIQNQWRILTKEKGVDIAVIDMPLLDTRRDKDLVGVFLSDTILSLLSFCAANERDNIRKRQADGIKAAKKCGVKFGRTAIKPPENFENLVIDWKKGNIRIDDILAKCNFSERTFYRRIKEIATPISK